MNNTNSSESGGENDQHIVDIADMIEAQSIGRFRVLVMIWCALVVLLDGFDAQMVAYLGPAIATDLQLGRNELGLIFSAGLAGIMAGYLLVGPLADQLGRKTIILVSVGLFGLFTLLAASAGTATELISYRFIAGIGLGGAMPNALALTDEYCPRKRRATLVIIMFSGFSVGSILAGSVAIGLISHLGWRSVLIVGGVLPLLGLPFLASQLPESLLFLVAKNKPLGRIEELVRRIDPDQAARGARYATADVESSGIPAVQLFRSGRWMGTLLLWIVFLMNLMVIYFLQNWLPTVFTDSGFSNETAIFVTTLIFVGAILAGILSGPLMDRYGPYVVLVRLLAAATVLVPAIGLTGSSIVVAITTTFSAGFCAAGAQKCINALAVIFYPTEIRATGVGWALGIGRVGSIVGTSIGGWLLSNHVAVSGIFLFAGIPMLIATIAMFAMGFFYRDKALAA